MGALPCHYGSDPIACWSSGESAPKPLDEQRQAPPPDEAPSHPHPGGNFFSNAAKVIGDPAVNFWVALWNSIISSGLIALSVVFFSTLAGWAFAKLKFRGSSWLLVFVIATMAVPTQLGVVPLYILFSDLGWTGQLGAIIVPALVSAFGVFWMT